MRNNCPERRFVLVAVWVCALSFFVSCKPTVPSRYIQPDAMEDILYDYHISQVMGLRSQSAELSSVHMQNLYYHAVLRKYGVTEAEFDSSLVYYYSHADKLRDIYKRVSERMEADAIRLGASAGEIAKYSQLNADGDTANIWRGARDAMLVPAPPYNRMDFTIEADSTFRRGDSFLFNFMTDFVYQSGSKDAVVCMAVRYDNDSVSTHYNHISVSGLSQLRVQGNNENSIKAIKGFIYLNRGSDMSATLKLMFIDGIQLIRFHNHVSEEVTDSISKINAAPPALVDGDTSRQSAVVPEKTTLRFRDSQEPQRVMMRRLKTSEEHKQPASPLRNDEAKNKADSRK